MQTKNLPWEGYGYFLEPHIIGSVRFAMEGYNVKFITQSAAVCHHATLIVSCAECTFFLSEEAKGLISV